MSNVIIFAADDVAEQIKKACADAGIEAEIEVVAPTAASLLHIAIGMLDDEPTEPAEPTEPTEPAEDDTAEATPKEPVEDEEPVEESVRVSFFGTGVSVMAEFVNAERTVLESPSVTSTTVTVGDMVKSLSLVNEAGLAEAKAAFILLAEANGTEVMTTLPVLVKSGETMKLKIGRDLQHLFK